MHAHNTIQHLIQPAEEYRQRREQKDLIPENLLELIEQVAELFEPKVEAARVGYTCYHDGDTWNISLFLGEAEVLGGADDGRRTRIGFHFPIHRMTRLFESIQELQLDAIPSSIEQCSQDCSMLNLTGEYTGETVRLSVLSIPPEEAGAGVHVHPDGSIQAAT